MPQVGDRVIPRRSERVYEIFHVPPNQSSAPPHKHRRPLRPGPLAPPSVVEASGTLARNMLPDSMSQAPAGRSSLTRRSWRVRLTPSTRPLAWLELAQMISMFNSANARPNCFIPEPPLASGLFTRKTAWAVRSESSSSTSRQSVVRGEGGKIAIPNTSSTPNAFIG
jgi:hypothetical protein